LKAALPLAFAATGWALAGCARKAPPDDPARLAMLQESYTRLHERLEKAAAADPLVASALAARGHVVLAIRSGLIEELAGNVARRHLDRVTVDLSEVEAHGSGELRKKTLLDRIKLGDWSVDVELGDLKADLRAGTPRVALRGPDRIDIQLPVDVEAAQGEARLHFRWDSAGLANVVCKDFALTRDLRGRVLAQRQLVSGALRVDSTGESLTLTPVFPDREIQLKLELTAGSWGVVEAALRSQDTSGKCGTLMDPEKGLALLKDLAAKGIKVKLPDSIFRTVTLPARLRQSVNVNQRAVELRLTAESVRIEHATLWSSVSVQARTRTSP
jgi:hypothetical protein